MARASLRRHANHEPAQLARYLVQPMMIHEVDDAITLCCKLPNRGIEWRDKFFNTLVFQLLGHQLESNSKPLKVSHDALGLRHVLFHSVVDVAMITERCDRLYWHGIDGQRPDERLDIHEVAIRRIFRARACPQHALRSTAPAGELLPLLACKRALKALIGKLGVSNRSFAQKSLWTRFGYRRSGWYNPLPQ